MPSPLPSLAAGLLAAGAFLLLSQPGMALLMFLPSLPLLLMGMAASPRAGLRAALVAAFITALAAGLPAAIFFLLLVGLPSSYLAGQAMRHGQADGETTWFPVGAAFAPLAAYASALIGLLTIYYAGQEGGISGALALRLPEAMSDMEADYAEAIRLLNRWSFLIFSTSVWMWALALYGHLWLAHRILAARGRIARPSVGLTPFLMPNWMLSLLVIAALAALIGSAPMRFFGQSALIALLLPYCLSGVAFMHHATRDWPNRVFFLFFVYFMAAAQFWPALALSGIGLWQHIKRLSGSTSSFKH